MSVGPDVPLRSKSAGLTLCRPLRVYPEHRTSPDRSGWPSSYHNRPHGKPCPEQRTSSKLEVPLFNYPPSARTNSEDGMVSLGGLEVYDQLELCLVVGSVGLWNGSRTSRLACEL